MYVTIKKTFQENECLINIKELLCIIHIYMNRKWIDLSKILFVRMIILLLKKELNVNYYNKIINFFFFKKGIIFNNNIMKSINTFQEN